MKNICLIYDFTAEKLISEWLGFCSKKTWPTDLDQAKVELFENEGFRQEKLKLDNKQETNLKENDKLTTHIQLDVDMLNDYGVVITDDQLNSKNVETNVETNNHLNNNQTNGLNQNENQLNNSEKDQTVKSSSNQEITNDCILENKLNESVELGDNKIQNYFGDQLIAQEWVNTDKTKFTIEPLNPELHITKPYKTSQIKIHESNEILNEMIDEMYEQLRSKINLEEDNAFVGRVCLDLTSTKDKVLLFENPKYQRKLTLDLTKIQTYSVFPGKIVCFEGELKSDHVIVNKFYDDQLLLSPLNSKPIDNCSPIYLMVASGPISPSMSDDLSSLEYLLEQVKIYQPHYLILLGPFFDCRNDYLLFNCDGENFFNKIMKLISYALDNLITEALIIPSIFDLNTYNIFPGPPFEHSFPKVHFMPNPSFLNLNGIIISLSSADIIRHILRDEVKK